jgi:DNA transposition AAA+ family ATPase
VALTDYPPNEIPFKETRAATRFREGERLSHLEGAIVVVCGDPGTGKTKACRQCADENVDVLLFDIHLGYSPRALFTELHKRLGFEGRGSICAMFSDCVGRLKNSGRLLIFDEAEYLPYRALELLRRLHDMAGIGILLVGLPRLIENLRGKRGEYSQLYSRVGALIKLEALQEGDTEMLVKSVLPSLNGMWRVFHEQCHGNARVLSKLLFRSMQIAKINGKVVTPEIVRGAAQTLII